MMPNLRKRFYLDALFIEKSCFIF